MFDLATRCHLALGDLDEAETCATRARGWADQVDLPSARSMALHASAACAFARGSFGPAMQDALSAAAAADSVGARIDAARCRILAGQALAASGEANPGRRCADRCGLLPGRLWLAPPPRRGRARAGPARQAPLPSYVARLGSRRPRLPHRAGARDRRPRGRSPHQPRDRAEDVPVHQVRRDPSTQHLSQTTSPREPSSLTSFYLPGTIGEEVAGIGDEAQFDPSLGMVLFRLGDEVVSAQRLAS